MGTYEIIVITLFTILMITFAWNSIKLYQQTKAEEDRCLRKTVCKKLLGLIVAAIVCLLCVLYVIFRIGWMLAIVIVLGTMVFAYCIGSGIGDNMNKHGGN